MLLNRVECGPLVLYYIESIAKGRKLTQEEALDMRKTMLKRFAHDEEKSWRVD